MNDTLMLSIINEWRSPDLKIKSDIIMYIIIAIPLLSFVMSKRSIDFTDFCFIGAFTYLSCKSVRFTALLFIVATFILIKYIENIKHNIKLNPSFKFTDENYLLVNNAFSNLMNVCTVFCLLVVFYGHNNLNISESFFTPVISNEIIQTIKEENPKKLYNDYDYGGYLIYNDIKVFVDGRADMYSGHNFEDVFIIEYYATPNLLEKYDFDMFLISKGSAIYNYLNNHNDYKELISDEKCAVLKKVK